MRLSFSEVVGAVGAVIHRSVSAFFDKICFIIEQLGHQR